MPDGHAGRKHDHLRICAEEAVGPAGWTSGLESYRLPHCALPEMALEQVDLKTLLLGKTLGAPVLISAITGGTPEARTINRNLARAAQHLSIGMCVGSQRAAIENPRQAPTYQVRDVAPDILLFANLGAVQLNYGYGLDQCRQAVEMINADALVLHLNPLQEALQPEGNTDFTGLLAKIADVCQGLCVPVIVKEVGWGLSEEVARQLVGAGVAALDVAGAGGTSWSEVERHRARTVLQERIAADFAGWGISTAEAIVKARRAAPKLPIIASGGIYSGPAAAVALALGADLVGLARPLLAPATVSAQAVQEELGVLIEGLRIAMFAAGLPNIAALKQAPLEKGALVQSV
ncbi:MAG: type 2 isopentenyl-diphosphate Delta-isomerase [Chloroflexi bacterium]|nr:type 2 isopentenyl-diphosphate Delta-isomerase [Chloroflexota bacterium]